MRPNVVLYFVKYPAPGKVKTRLAQTIGSQKAVRLYSELAERNCQVIEVLDQRRICDVVVVYDPPEKRDDIRRWLALPCYYLPQCEGGLSERLIHAFREVFQRGARRVVAVGSDTLGLTTHIVQQGFEALQSNDVAVGPAEDGGYYLIGLSSFQPGVFEGIHWSTDAVLPQTYHRIQQLGLSYQSLPPLEDLDEINRTNTVGEEKAYELSIH